jgi:hypothetical protein
MNFFRCKKCGWDVSRLAGPEPIKGEVCFLCTWIETNKHLTEKEKEELMIRFRSKPRAVEDT